MSNHSTFNCWSVRRTVGGHAFCTGRLHPIGQHRIRYSFGESHTFEKINQLIERLQHLPSIYKLEQILTSANGHQPGAIYNRLQHLGVTPLHEPMIQRRNEGELGALYSEHLTRI